MDLWDEFRWGAAHQEALEAFRAKGCWICGTRDRYLTAHHIYPPDKMFNVCKAKCMNIGVTAFTAELEKCACLCRSCHDLVHGIVRKQGAIEDIGKPGDPYPVGLTKSQRNRLAHRRRVKQREQANKRRKNGQASSDTCSTVLP